MRWNHRYRRCGCTTCGGIVSYDREIDATENHSGDQTKGRYGGNDADVASPTIPLWPLKPFDQFHDRGARYRGTPRRLNSNPVGRVDPCHRAVEFDLVAFRIEHLQPIRGVSALYLQGARCFRCWMLLRCFRCWMLLRATIVDRRLLGEGVEVASLVLGGVRLSRIHLANLRAGTLRERWTRTRSYFFSVTVNVCPAIVNVPVRLSPLFGATV